MSHLYLINNQQVLLLSDINPIGEGCFNYVWRAHEPWTGQLYAVKTPKTPYKHYLIHESHISREFPDQLFISCLGDNFSHLDILPAQPGMVFPWAVPFLGHLVHKMAPEELRTWCYQLLNAVLWLRERQYVHTDLHAGNILIHQGMPKIGDFGGLVRYRSSTPPIFAKDTPYYSPEMQRGEWHEDADEWSMALMIYQLCYGKSTTTKALIHNNFEQITPIPKHPGLAQALKSCLHPDRQKRGNLNLLLDYFRP